MIIYVRSSGFLRCALQMLRLVGSVVLAVVVPEAVSPQPTTRVADRVSCAQCKIELERVVRLQPGSGPQELSRRPSSMATDSRGRILVAVDGSDHVDLYARDGAFLQQVGRRGAGPGEFTSANYVSFGPGDTAYVFDIRNRRVSIFTPEMKFLRSAPAPFMFSATALVDGSFLINGFVPDRDRIGKSFHLFDRIGNQLRSFGFADASVIPGQGGLANNWVTPSRTGGVWSVSYRGAYTLAKWGNDGALLQRFDVASILVGPEMGKQVGFTSEKPADPYIRSLVEDLDGLIWVEIVVADSNWKKGVKFDPSLPGERGMFPDIMDYDRAYDTVIEVFDPEKRTRIVSHRFDSMYSHFVAPNRIARPIVQPDGTFHIEIYSLRLTGLSTR